MSKRDFIAELKDFAKRPAFAAGNTAADWARLREIARLHRAMDALNPDSLPRRELAKHVLVSLGAVMQAAVHRTLEEVIDAKEKRGEKIPELASLNIPLSTDLAREIRGQSFSVGRFVARFLKVNSVDSVAASIRQVCGKSLEAVLKPGFQALAAPDAPAQNIDRRIAQVLRRLETLFSQARLLCREEVLELKVEPPEVDTYIEDVIWLVAAITHFRYHEINASPASSTGSATPS